MAGRRRRTRLDPERHLAPQPRPSAECAQHETTRRFPLSLAQSSAAIAMPPPRGPSRRRDARARMRPNPPAAARRAARRRLPPAKPSNPRDRTRRTRSRRRNARRRFRPRGPVQLPHRVPDRLPDAVSLRQVAACAPYNYAKSASDQQKFCGFGAAPASASRWGSRSSTSSSRSPSFASGFPTRPHRPTPGKLVHAGAGARLYTMSDSRFKIFFSPWLGARLHRRSGPSRPAKPRRSRADDDAQPDHRRILPYRHPRAPRHRPSVRLSREASGSTLSGGLTFQMLRYLGASARSRLSRGSNSASAVARPM